MADQCPKIAELLLNFKKYPDLVHHPEWGTIELKAGQKKTFITEYLFTTN